MAFTRGGREMQRLTERSLDAAVACIRQCAHILICTHWALIIRYPDVLKTYSYISYHRVSIGKRPQKPSGRGHKFGVPSHRVQIAPAGASGVYQARRVALGRFFHTLRSYLATPSGRCWGTLCRLAATLNFGFEHPVSLEN
eukprot:1156896-Pelagomonas_calceolata.AAC.8